jgi:hypothetical protein
MTPSMPPSNLLRALRGPVMMMTLGTILAFDHFTNFDFSDTWPLLLIVAGAMKLAEHMMGRAPGTGSPYSGV